MRSPHKILLGLLVLLSGVYTGVALGQETLPRLVDIGASAGFNLVGHGRGTAWADLDGDGLEDFGVGLMADGLLHPGGFFYYKNLGNHQFEERREQAGLIIEDTVYGVTFPDVDNDGDSDVFVNCGGYQVTAPFPEKNRLFLNDGHGVFTEVPDAGGLALEGFNFTSAWDDVNGDGLLDVFICRLDSDGNTPDRRLFVNRGNATFEDVTEAAGLLSTTVDSHQAVFLDYDNDGDPDLALANRDGRVSLEEPPRPPNQLYRNDGNLQFVDVSQQAGISNGFAGFVNEVADYDRDGDMDIFMGAYNNLILGTFVPGAHDALYRNDGNGHFAEVAVAAGVANVGGSMGARFWDMDNDGYPDLYVSKGGAEPNRVETDLMYHNMGDGTFQQVGSQVGLTNRTAGHGPTACDFDHDGDLDFLLPSGSMVHATAARSLLYENQGPAGSAISFRPQGEFGNKDGVGARVFMTMGSVHVMGQITAGSGYSSMAPQVAWFGVGDATTVDEVTVIWRSGLTRTATNVPVVREIDPLLPVAFQLQTPEIKSFNPFTGGTLVRFQWEDKKPSGQGHYEITISGNVEGVSLPIVAQTDVANFEASLPAGTYNWSVRLLDGLGEVSRATPDAGEVVVQPNSITKPALLASSNPFTGSVQLAALVPPGSPPAEVEIIDLTGARVALLGSSGGNSLMVWDGRTTRGTTAPPGIYWAHLRSASGGVSVKLVKL
jgi:hypothetical protein